MLNNKAKQAYTTPQFQGKLVQLESALCETSLHPVDSKIVNESYMKASTGEQTGWDEQSGGFVDNNFGS